MRMIIKNGRVVDPDQDLDEIRDVLVEDGRIADLAKPGQAEGWASQDQTFEAGGLIVTPGLIDMHVHLREPGYEYKESIASGTAAAAAGGFTAVATMPNTKPVNDQRSVTEFILRQAQAAGPTRVWPVAAMTMGQTGEMLAEYGDLAEAGAVAVSDDGKWVPDGKVMRRVMEYARIFGLAAISHAEDHSLSLSGVMNEGLTATRLGLAGIPPAAEDAAVYRDVRLAELTQTPIHIAHVSTAGAVEIIRRAKAAGVPVTAETAPHYFTLTEESVIGYQTRAKMNPPLRTRLDMEAIRAGLGDGTLDCIATDHAPHSVLEKDVEFDQAAFGIVGLETALPLSLDLVRDKVLSLAGLVKALSLNPARILNQEAGVLKPGWPADITVFDPDRTWTVDPVKFRSKGRYTPFEGRTVSGLALLTMVGGEITHNLLV